MQGTPNEALGSCVRSADAGHHPAPGRPIYDIAHQMLDAFNTFAPIGETIVALQKLMMYRGYDRRSGA
jgi:hypothetical protein